ncbi:unnamed protein product, partial [Prorocentrum cordatum]
PEARGKHVFTRTPNATGPICVPCRSPSRWNAAVTAAAMYSTPELTREERGEEEDENEEKQRGPYGTAAARTPAAAAVAWRRPRWLAHRAGRRPKASKPRRPGTRVGAAQKGHALRLFVRARSPMTPRCVPQGRLFVPGRFLDDPEARRGPPKTEDGPKPPAMTCYPAARARLGLLRPRAGGLKSAPAAARQHPLIPGGAAGARAVQGRTAAICCQRPAAAARVPRGSRGRGRPAAPPAQRINSRAEREELCGRSEDWPN